MFAQFIFNYDFNSIISFNFTDSIANRIDDWLIVFSSLNTDWFHMLFGYGASRNILHHPYLEIASAEYLYRYGLAGTLSYYLLLFGVFRCISSSYSSDLYLYSCTLLIIFDTFITISQQPKAVFLIPIFFVLLSRKISLFSTSTSTSSYL